MTDQDQLEKAVEEANGSTYNLDRIVSLTTWLGFLSWIFLALGSFKVIGGVVLIVTNPQGLGEVLSQAPTSSVLSLISLYLGDVYVGLLYVLLYFILRIVSEGIFVLVDIEFNTRKVDE
jgi:hypothetical protein